MPTTKERMQRAEERAEQFNESNPVGTRVRYYPIVGEPKFIESVTRTPAWALPCMEAVVSIEGKSGGLSLDHIEILPAAALVRE